MGHLSYLSQVSESRPGAPEVLNLDGDGFAFFLGCRFSGRGFKGSETEKDSCDEAAEAGHQEEEPDLRHCPAAGKECGPEAAGRIHTCAGDVDADEVNCRERDADCEAGESGRRGGLSGAEDHNDEDEGCDEFVGDGGGDVVSAHVAGAPAVLAEVASNVRIGAANDERQYARAED